MNFMNFNNPQNIAFLSDHVNRFNRLVQSYYNKEEKSVTKATEPSADKTEKSGRKVLPRRDFVQTGPEPSVDQYLIINSDFYTRSDKIMYNGFEVMRDAPPTNPFANTKSRIERNMFFEKYVNEGYEFTELHFMTTHAKDEYCTRFKRTPKYASDGGCVAFRCVITHEVTGEKLTSDWVHYHDYGSSKYASERGPIEITVAAAGINNVYRPLIAALPCIKTK